MNVSCEWPVSVDCLPSFESGDPDREAKAARLQDAVDTAVQVLWALTGRQFGCQTLVARPCPGWDDPRWEDYQAAGGSGFMPVLYGGQWSNVYCGSGCLADGPSIVTLPGPVAGVDGVDVDGDEIDPDGWRIEGDRLYRAGGRSWPSQDLSKPLGEPGTWGVRYRRGVEPPAGAGIVVGQLALEFWNVCEPGVACRLPRRWQTVTRQGMTISKADPTDILASGRTGLAEIDTWIVAHNPNGLDRPSTVSSPDRRGATWR